MATHLIFHLRPIAIAAGSIWVYRHLHGERPRTTRSLVFLIGVAALLSAGGSVLAPQGLTDSPALAGAIGVAGLVAREWILPRSPRTSSPPARPHD